MLTIHTIVGTTSKHAYFHTNSCSHRVRKIPYSIQCFIKQYISIWWILPLQESEKMWWYCEWRYKFEAALGELMMKGYKAVPFSCCLSEQWHFRQTLSSPPAQQQTCCQLWYCDPDYARTMWCYSDSHLQENMGKKCIFYLPPFPPLI